ncbi:uncharacterized protein LOC117118987 [Anneissia japonica]|uniref:uncharacterized protein LOC117118987 n=1 Tax=Anneissia japonica TaxID=1529436 RepID=UPI001425B4E9|nr:uncharacterized protein LOC117118987 [Anneissia japonica]XP_033119643.1 uncharacterized protein LOC117118987 [Anneissia japonica]
MENPCQRDGLFRGGGGGSSVKTVKNKLNPKPEEQVQRHVKGDKIVVVDGNVFSVNSIVLATQSSFFQSMFTSGMIETNERKVVLKDPLINPKGFRDWLAEISSPGSVDLTTGNILDVWKVANFTQSHWVLHRCKCTISALVLSYLNYSTSIKEFVISVYSLAYLFDDKCLQNLTRDFVSDNVSEALHNSEFQNAIGGGKLLEILKARDLLVLSEEELFLGIMDWINFDVIAREPFLVDILKLLYLHEVPAATLKENLYRGKFMMDKQFLELYFSAIDETKEIRPRRPAYQRCSLEGHKFLVTFKCKRPMYYEHEEDKWHPLPGATVPPGRIIKCTSTFSTIYALVKSTNPVDSKQPWAEDSGSFTKIWEYSCQTNKWEQLYSPTSNPDDLLYLQGTLYLMDNWRMWKRVGGSHRFTRWSECERCDRVDTIYRQTISFGFGKYIIRFGRCIKSRKIIFKCYDVNYNTYRLIGYQMARPIIVQKGGVHSVMMIDGSGIYDWYKWVKYCINNDEVMDSKSGAAFLLPQDGSPRQQSNRAILLKGKLHYVVGQTLFLPNADRTNSKNVCRNITKIKKKVSILPGDKNIASISLLRECFL